MLCQMEKNVYFCTTILCYNYSLIKKSMVKNLRFLLMSMLVMLGMTVMADDLTVTFIPGETVGSNTTASGEDTMTKDGITISTTSGGLAAAQYRMAKGSVTTISSAVGNITKIVFTCTASGDTKYGPGCFAAQEGYSYEDAEGTWTGNAASVTFEAESAQVRATQIVVYVGEGGGETPDPEPEPDPEPVDAVKATCAEIIAGADGTVYEVKGVCTEIKNTLYGNWMLTDETGEVYIYGTLDAQGQSKNFESLGIEVGDTITVKGPKTTYKETVELVNVSVIAIAKKQGGDDPEPSLKNVTVAEALAIIDALEPKAVTEETYLIEGYVVSLDEEFNPVYGNYTLNLGDTPNAAVTLKVYRAKDADNQKFTEDIVKVGNKIQVQGKLQKYVKGEEVIPETYNAVILTVDGKSTSGINVVKAVNRFEGAIYNMKGQRVNSPSRGLYIMNGKKYFVK